MIRRRWIVETIVSLMISVFFINVISPSMSFAANVSENVNVIATADSQTKPSRVVVSMGDSYSSGEGIEPFFGDGSDPKKPEFVDWLAHRSQYSWPGQLKLSNTGEMKKYKDSYISEPNKKDDVKWYFVASSGAETKDIMGWPEKINGKIMTVGQKKEYTANRIINQQQVVYLAPQIDVLNELNKNGVVPDYITLTLGGNDLGFADVITTAATYSTYLTPFFLYNKLKEAEEKLENTTRNDINKAYHDINTAASIGDKKPHILVAGYPLLLDLDGKGLPFAEWESKMIDNDVAYFNSIIEQEVNKCKGDMNIEYVNVMTKEFTKHAAYSEDPWINEIKLVRTTDLDRSKPILPSAASIHPNKKGAKEYARCVQNVIDSIEKEKSYVPSDSTTETTKPSETPSITETTVPTTTTLAPLTDDQALTAIRNYLYEELGYDQYNGEAPWYLDLDGKSDSSTAVVHLRAYTGSHNFFYIDRISGETHEKAYPPHLTVDVDEPIDGATFNARDYLNRKPTSTEGNTSQSDMTSSESSTKSIGDTKVTTVKKVYKDEFEGGKVTVKIPKLSIEGVNTDSINDKMSKEIIKACSGKVSDGKKWYRTYRGSKIEYYIGKTYVSIIVDVEPFASDPAIYVYNISRETGKHLSRKEMLTELSISNSNFESRTLKAIKKYWEPELKRAKKYNNKEELKSYKEAISNKTLSKAIPCVNAKGKICAYLELLPDWCGQGCNDHVLTI